MTLSRRLCVRLRHCMRRLHRWMFGEYRPHAAAPEEIAKEDRALLAVEALEHDIRKLKGKEDPLGAMVHNINQHRLRKALDE